MKTLNRVLMTLAMLGTAASTQITNPDVKVPIAVICVWIFAYILIGYVWEAISGISSKMRKDRA